MNPKHRSRSLPRAALLASLLVAAALPAAEKPFAGLVVTNAIITPLDWSDKEPYLGYMVVGPDGRITALGEGEAPASAFPVLDAGGKIVMPGFLSVHSHLSGSVSRGRAADQWVTEWRLSGSRSRGAEVNPEGTTYSTTLHGAMDFLFGGVTCTYNYASMGRTPESVDEQLQAVLDAGGHYVFGTNIPENSPNRDELAAYLRKFVAGVKNKPGAERILKLSMSSVAMRWTEEESKYEFELLKSIPEFGMDMEMHYLEPPPNVPRTVYERSNFVWLEKYGILGPNLTYAHFCHPTEEILTKSIAAGATMSWNPLSNARLASGLTDVTRFRKMGMTVGMGLDGMGSADIADPFQNMRVGLYGLRFRDQNPNVMSPREILHLHTLESAKAMRVAKDVGSLEVGKYADFLVIDQNEPSTGPLYNVYATLVFACSRANIDAVYVAGRAVIKNHEFVNLDIKQVQKNTRYRLQRAK